MKNFKLFALGLLSAALFLTSCEDDEDSSLGPVLSVMENGTNSTGGDISVQPGALLAFTWRADKGDTDLETFAVSTTGGEWPNPLPASMGGNTFPYDVANADDEIYIDTLYVMIGNNESVNSITFTATDKDGNTDQVTFDVTVETPETPFASEVQGAFFHIQGTAHGAYDLVEDMTRSVSDANVDKDMINIDAAGATFTGSWDAGSGNGTTYVKDNSYDYTNATVESAMAAFASGSASSSVMNPQNGDVYIANLRGGSDYAVIMIVDVDPDDTTGGTGNTGKITFDYKK